MIAKFSYMTVHFIHLGGQIIELKININIVSVELKLNDRTTKISQIYQCNNWEDPIRFDAMVQRFLVAVNMSEIRVKLDLSPFENR